MVRGMLRAIALAAMAWVQYPVYGSWANNWAIYERRSAPSGEGANPDDYAMAHESRVACDTVFVDGIIIFATTLM